jgi:ADP-heptose:LPS heptosyltransferase
VGARWPIQVLCAGLATWNSRFGLARRRPSAAPRRILVAHHFLLGDTIMLAPLLKKLRVQFPAAEIVMTCRPGLVPLLAGRPYGVHAVPFDPRDVRTFPALYRLRGFDLALLPADNRYSWLARALDSRWIVAFDGDRPGYKNWLVDEFRSYPKRAMALGDLFAECLVDGPPPAAYETTDWPAPPAADFALPQKPYAVLHVGAGSPLRLWDATKWREVAAALESLGIAVVLSAGPGEDRLIADIDDAGRLTSFRGTLSLPQLWRLLAGARAVVCPDTGISHLARLVGVPLVVLFGPGSATLFGGGEFWSNMPSRRVTIPRFPCRDENIIFRRHLGWAEHCARNTAACSEPRCMHALTADMVAAALQSLHVSPA